jgi:hypothetical protein
VSSDAPLPDVTPGQASTARDIGMVVVQASALDLLLLDVLALLGAVPRHARRPGAAAGTRTLLRCVDAALGRAAERCDGDVTQALTEARRTFRQVVKARHVLAHLQARNRAVHDPYGWDDHDCAYQYVLAPDQDGGHTAAVRDTRQVPVTDGYLLTLAQKLHDYAVAIARLLYELEALIAAGLPRELLDWEQVPPTPDWPPKPERRA